jgi:transposase
MLDSTPVSAPVRCAGLDVSMEHVDFFFSTGKETLSGRLPRQAEQLDSLARQLRDAGAELVVLEATGGYGTLPWSVFEHAGLAVAVVNPRRVRHFAGSLGLQAKTDRLDAILLAQFGERLRPAATPLPDAHMRGFQQLLRHLAEVVDQRARWRTTLHRAEGQARASLQRLIAAISAEIRLLEQQLDAAASCSPELLTLTGRLQTAPGVGPKTAWMLAAEMPELGSISARQAASLAGLAPRARDSGNYRGRRTIGGGRPRVRRALFVAAWNARRRDAGVAAFYDRLLAAGKPRKVINIAVARKLLVALNSMIHNHADWRPARAC